MDFRKATTAEAVEIDALLNMDYPDLEAEFGKRLGHLDDTKTSLEIAKIWLQKKHSELVDLICVKGNYCEFSSNHKNSEMVDVIASVADLIAKSYGSLPVYYMATLIVRRGLDTFCDC